MTPGRIPAAAVRTLPQSINDRQVVAWLSAGVLA
jgi:hypothetical protein